MTNLAVHFMSQSVDWATPARLYNDLHEEFHFAQDPAPLHGAESAPTMLYDSWRGPVFVNPPYGREISKWTGKALIERANGQTVVMLLPSRTDTAWWHDHVMKADEIRFIRGRLTFGDAKNPAPFPSAVVVFRGAL